MSVYVRLTSSRDEENVVFQERHLILVEGKDDRTIVAALIKHENLHDFQVHHMWGRSTWAAQVGVIVRQPEFHSNVKTLGLMKDADEDPDAAWASCRDTLTASSLPVPTAAIQLAEGIPSTAVMIVPSRAGRGALEELCIKSFEAGRLECVDRYFDCLSPGHSAATRLKARVQAYLAGLESVPRDITIAAHNHELDMGNSAFDELRQFVHRLSQEPGVGAENSSDRLGSA
jgi:hypothetical protein